MDAEKADRIRGRRFWIMLFSWFSIPALIPLLGHLGFSFREAFGILLIYTVILSSSMAIWASKPVGQRSDAKHKVD